MVKTEKLKERPQKGRHKRKEGRLGKRPKQTVCSAAQMLPFFFFQARLKSITRCRWESGERAREGKRKEQSGKEREQEQGRA